VVTVIGSVALSGCGATRAPTVASVQGTPISSAMLAHWTRIKRIEMQSAPALRSTGTPTELERKALAFLITADWLEAEAAARGVVVSATEVNATYHELASGPTGQAFVSSLKRRGMSRADELLELRLDNLTHKLEVKIVAGGGGVSPAGIARYYHSHAGLFRAPGHKPQTLATATPAIRQTLVRAGQDERLSAFIAEYRRRWKLRTSCQPGYVVRECRNGPPLPGAPTK
jgi:hypothetical protein